MSIAWACWARSQQAADNLDVVIEQQQVLPAAYLRPK